MSPRDYQRIPVSGFEIGFEGEDEYEGSCRLSISPYALLKWPESYSLVGAKIQFSGSPFETQRIEAETNDEFSPEQLSELKAALERLCDGNDTEFELRGGDAAFQMAAAHGSENLELRGEIGSPYLHDTLAQMQQKEHVFISSCRFSFAANRESLAKPIVEIQRLLDYLEGLG